MISSNSKQWHQAFHEGQPPVSGAAVVGAGAGPPVASPHADMSVGSHKGALLDTAGILTFRGSLDDVLDRFSRAAQRFQAAVFEYHPEYDIPGFVPGTNVPYRNFRALLELLGDKYIELNKLPYR